MKVKSCCILIKNKTKTFFKVLVLKERSPEKLAISFAMGVYIAICPFVGLHTAMIFVFAWMFRLNTAVTFATGYAVNNIFTMGPIFLADYGVGYWLLHSIMGLQTHHINPFWVTYVNDFLYNKLSIPNACFWSFMIGGNILSIGAAVLSYPIVKFLFKRLSLDMDGRKTDEMMDIS